VVKTHAIWHPGLFGPWLRRACPGELVELAGKLQHSQFTEFGNDHTAIGDG